MAWKKRVQGTGSITAGHSAKAAGYSRCGGCGEFTRCKCPTPAELKAAARKEMMQAEAKALKGRK